MATQNKTIPTDGSVDEFVQQLTDERKRDDSRQLIALMSDISGEPAVMWGPSIVGFGRQSYVYDSGRSGEVPRLGFSPRKAALTIYFNEGFDRYGSELSRLGQHTSSVSCLYVKRLEEIDLGVLEAMLKKSFEGQSVATKPGTVEEYVHSIPVAARPHFDVLRQLVRELAPEAEEVLSYGIVAYKVDAKRARVFISGWKDHVAMYPVPADQSLQAEMKPYVRGSGTLWFALDEPLPEALVRKVVKGLLESGGEAAPGILDQVQDKF